MPGWIDVAIWNGSPAEALRLSEAVAHHCRCLELRRRCPAHEMMLDQHALDHLLYWRWAHLKEVERCKSQPSARIR